MVRPASPRVAVVANARAGAFVGKTGQAPSLEALLAQAGLNAEFIPPDLGTLPDRMAGALALKPDAIIVAGGDGTIACAAQTLAGSDIPLGILPFGTMNLLAKDLGLPIGDPAQAIKILADWHIRAIDAGEVNGHVFLCASMLGLPARLGRHREAIRGASLTGAARMARATFRGLWTFVPFRAELEFSGQTIPLRAAALTITVNPVAESSGARFARKELDTGILALYAVQSGRIASLLGFMLRVLAGRWRRDSTLAEYSAPAFTLQRRGRATRVMNDGELLLLAPPLAYRILPGALRVIAPP